MDVIVGDNKVIWKGYLFLFVLIVLFLGVFKDS